MALERVYFFILDTKRRLVLLRVRFKVIFDRLIRLRLRTRNKGAVRLLLKRVIKIVELGSFIWTRVVAGQVVCPNFIFDMRVCSALGLRLCNNLWSRVLFVLLVAQLFSLLHVIMSSGLL